VGDTRGPFVEPHDDTVAGVVGTDHWAEVARSCLIGEGVARGHLDLAFVDGAEMADLNQTHMGSTGPTDVLSFPLDAADMGDPDAVVSSSEVPVHLGDIVVCPAVARAQAGDHTGTYEAEMTLLVIHGVLHILGHDHAEPDEAETMVGRERHYLEAAGFTHPNDHQQPEASQVS